MQDENARMESLRDLKVLDTPPELALDELVRFASQRFSMPIALISLVDERRQWFKARVGLDVQEAPREIAFCDHTIREEEVMVVTDATQDPRFADNPLVTGQLSIRFYAGAPLEYRGQRIGTCCVIDTNPRSFTDQDRADLAVLAKATVAELEMSRARRYRRDDR